MYKMILRSMNTGKLYRKQFDSLEDIAKYYVDHMDQRLHDWNLSHKEMRIVDDKFISLKRKLNKKQVFVWNIRHMNYNEDGTYTLICNTNTEGVPARDVEITVDRTQYNHIMHYNEYILQ